MLGDDDSQPLILKLGSPSPPKDLLHIQHPCTQAALCQKALQDLQRTLCLRQHGMRTADEREVRVTGHTQFSESSLLCVVQLGPLDNDSMSREVDAPGQCGCAAQHLEQALPKEAFHQVAACGMAAASSVLGRSLINISIVTLVHTQQQQHKEHLLEANFIHDVLGGHDVFVCGANELHGKGHWAVGGIKVEQARLRDSKEGGHVLVVG
ncbi:MAG: hypothetical protein FRX49_06063 [Trebouxia sp. A1-2]|nr:MAG: hypothetical protein FRX49_06063 [Trebouxia sp. A1-2]